VLEEGAKITGRLQTEELARFHMQVFMATVKEIVQDIKDTFGSSFINQTQASKYLGMGKEKVGMFLAAIPVYPSFHS